MYSFESNSNFSQIIPRYLQFESHSIVSTFLLHITRTQFIIISEITNNHLLTLFYQLSQNNARIFRKNKAELRLRNYSLKTIKAYLGCLREFLDFKKFNLEKIDE